VNKPIILNINIIEDFDMADNLIRLQNIVGKQLGIDLIKLSQKLISEN
jgi:hypothetical protein